MGRSTASCFKIIACGSDPVDRDELEVSESKSSSDRRGWSFGKRSARHHVLSNTVISETPSGNKDCPESAGIYSQTQPISDIPEKTPATQLSSFQEKAYATESKSNIPEKTYVLEPESNISEKNSTVDCIDESKFPTSVDTKMLKMSATEADDRKANVTPKEADIIIIQTAIRLFLAQKVLLKHKNVIKLQAAVRGHLVRRHAVGTLRCFQAIVKMQALVRARCARRCIEQDEKHEKDHHSSETLVTYTSIEKLLNNRFARQFLESSPRTKTINIKCDPSKSDSAWKWLERWMSVSPTKMRNSEISGEKQEKKMLEQFDNLTETVTQSESNFESSDIKCGTETSVVPSESEDNLITYDADSLDFQAHQLTSPSSYKLEEPLPQDLNKATSRDNSDFLPVPSMETIMNPSMEYGSLPVKTETGNKQQMHSVKRAALEQPEGKTFCFGSRKASNPAFVAAQSKFEELSSAANKAKVTSLSFQNIESCNYTISSTNSNPVRAREIILVENSDRHSSVQVEGSECDTELSITSTLDSPDCNDVGVQEFVQEVNSTMDTTIHHHNSNENLDIDANNQTFKGVDIAPSDSVQPERPNSSKEDNGHIDTVVALDLPPQELTLEPNATDVQMGRGPEMGSKVYKSPEASPRSHVTAPESQKKSFTQVSVKPKIRSEKSESNPKHGSSSDGKRLFSNSNHAAGMTSSEQLSKDRKSGKRQRSFVSTKSDHVDEEPRDSNSGNSLPSYMQATESARAKAISNSSPRSSPDAHKRDAYIKKRHSLSGSNGRQGSPRIQRSLSQAQHAAKGNGTHSPQEQEVAEVNTTESDAASAVLYD